MQYSSLFEGSLHPFTVNGNLSFNLNNNLKPNLKSTCLILTTFVSLTETKSYIPITCCILEHILTSTNLTYCEKSFYLLADSLALICKNKNGYRSCALPSEEWAKRLGCSRSLIFMMQQSLVEKGYFIINKDFDKIGRNKRNLITPTLPDSVFNHLNKKFSDRVGENLPYSPLTECKRSYLDRTKLFIRLNYDLLKIITSYKPLNSRQKIMWLCFYARSYKNYMLQNREDSSQNPSIGKYSYSNDSDSEFSFIASYSELAGLYSCNTKRLCKSIKALEELGFIKTQNFYIKKKRSDNKDNCSDGDRDSVNKADNNSHEIQERQDQSLWKITLSLPSDCILELKKVKDRSNLKLNDAENVTVGTVKNTVYSRIVENCLTLGGVKFTLNLEQVTLLKSLITYNAEDSTSTKEKSVSHSDNITVTTPLTNPQRSSESYIDSVMEELDALDASNVVNVDGSLRKFSVLSIPEDTNILPDASKTLLILPTTSSSLEALDNIDEKSDGIKSDPTVTNSGLLLNKDFITNKKNIKNIDSLDSEFVFFKKSVSSKNYFKELEKTEPVNKEKTTKNIISSVSSLPLTPFFTSKRLKDLYPLDKTLVYELNHKSGREFSLNFVNELLLKLDSKYPLKTFSNKKQIMNYLAKALQYEKHQEPVVNHESFKFASMDPEEQKKEKIDKYLAAVEANLNTNATSQLRRKIAALFNPEIAYRLLTESKYIRPQPEIFFVELAHNLNLTEIQQDRLTNEIQLIYGKEIEVMYGEMAASTLDNKATKIVRQEGEIYLEELDQDTAWYRVRVALRSQFGEVLDKAWFSKLTAEEDTAQRKITLKAPTNFIRDWVAQKYGAAIENSCKIINYQFDALVT